MTLSTREEGAGAGSVLIPFFPVRDADESTCISSEDAVGAVGA